MKKTILSITAVAVVGLTFSGCTGITASLDNMNQWVNTPNKNTSRNTKAYQAQQKIEEAKRAKFYAQQYEERQKRRKRMIREGRKSQSWDDNQIELYAENGKIVSAKLKAEEGIKNIKRTGYWKYEYLMGAPKTVKVKNSFGDIEYKRIYPGHKLFISDLNKAKTKKERTEILKNYYLAYYKKMGGGALETISNRVESYQLSVAMAEIANSLVLKNYIPATISVSLNDKKTKNGLITGSYDAKGLLNLLNNYGFVFNPHQESSRKLVEKRQLLLFSFFAYKERNFQVGDTGSKYDFGFINAFITLFNLVKDNDPQASKLITILASGNKGSVDKYLLSIPKVKYYFDFFSKNISYY